MNTIIYIRTSTEEQNPENQLEDCLSLLSEEEKKESKVYSEKQSAWKEDKERPKFEEIRKLIPKKQVKQIIVWDLDRLYRNRIKQKQFLEFCKIYNVILRSFRQKFLENLKDVPEPFNEILYDMLIQIFGYMAEEESRKKSERIRASIRIKDDGAYSYKGNKWGRKGISKQAIRKIIDLRNEGKSIREISNSVRYADKNNNMKNVSIGLVHKILSESDQKIIVNQEGS